MNDDVIKYYVIVYRSLVKTSNSLNEKSSKTARHVLIKRRKERINRILHRFTQKRLVRRRSFILINNGRYSFVPFKSREI